MELFFVLIVFWMAMFQAAKFGWKRWRTWNVQQPARYVSEVRSVDYYRRLPPDLFESLVLQALKARQFTLLDDPYLGRSKKQGYAWRAGKKMVVVHHPESSLPNRALEEIAKNLRTVRAEQALVFYPYPQGPASPPHDVTVLAGKKLLSWFSVLDTLPPPLPGPAWSEMCECGSPRKERINRAGGSLLVCTRLPDCRQKRELPSVPDKSSPRNLPARLSPARLGPL